MYFFCHKREQQQNSVPLPTATRFCRYLLNAWTFTDQFIISVLAFLPQKVWYSPDITENLLNMTINNNNPSLHPQNSD